MWFDGAGLTHSNITEARPQRALSMYDVRLHVLSSGGGACRPFSHAIEAQAG
jgi:hypothetical protein